MLSRDDGSKLFGSPFVLKNHLREQLHMTYASNDKIQHLKHKLNPFSYANLVKKEFCTELNDNYENTFYCVRVEETIKTSTFQ